MKLTIEQIDEVVKWMNTWQDLKYTVIPIRFREDFTKQLQQHSVGGPASASVPEGERLGNEAGEKSVRVDCDCKQEYAKYYIGWICGKCNKALRA